jgi:hypothetical protein
VPFPGSADCKQHHSGEPNLPAGQEQTADHQSPRRHPARRSNGKHPDRSGYWLEASCGLGSKRCLREISTKAYDDGRGKDQRGHDRHHNANTRLITGQLQETFAKLTPWGTLRYRSHRFAGGSLCRRPVPAPTPQSGECEGQ